MKKLMTICAVAVIFAVSGVAQAYFSDTLSAWQASPIQMDEGFAFEFLGATAPGDIPVVLFADGDYDEFNNLVITGAHVNFGTGDYFLGNGQYIDYKITLPSPFEFDGVSLSMGTTTGYNTVITKLVNGTDLLTVNMSDWTSDILAISGQTVTVRDTFVSGGRPWSVTNQFSVVPEPATMLLLGLGGVMSLVRRKRKA
jgi:hypothetical protein